MKIPVLHPELYMGTRGTKMAREIVRLLVKNGPESGPIKQAYIGTGFELNHILFQTRIMWPQIKESKKIYVIGKDFFSAIMSVNNDIPIALMPKSFNCYVGFPTQEELFIENEKIVGIYIGFFKIAENKANLRLFLHVGDEVTKGRPGLDAAPLGGYGGATLEIKDGKLIISDREFPTDSAKKTFIGALNIVAYIHSSQPDISWLKPKTSMTTSERKDHLAKGNYVSNDISVPVRLVSWNWQKPKHYSKDEWLRKMHLRWQRFGPGNTKVKLIWIQESLVKRRLEIE